MAEVMALCQSDRKGVRKTPVDELEFVVAQGVAGDAHAGAWHRQVSLLAEEDVAALRARGLPDLGPGDFGENVVLRGLDLAACGLGTRLRLGASVELAVSQIGKVCHTRCAIYHLSGDCIMPRLGVFARVLEGGRVRAGDPASILDLVPRDAVQAVVLDLDERDCLPAAQLADWLSRRWGAHTYGLRRLAPDDLDGRLPHYVGGHSLDLVCVLAEAGRAPRLPAAGLQLLPSAGQDLCWGLGQGTLVVALPRQGWAGTLEAIEHQLPGTWPGAARVVTQRAPL